MTPEGLSALVGLVLSLAFSYLPGLRNWFESLPSEQKALTMGAALVFFSVGSLLFSCRMETACLTASWEQYFTVLIAALVANQSTYLLAVRPFQKSS